MFRCSPDFADVKSIVPRINVVKRRRGRAAETIRISRRRQRSVFPDSVSPSVAVKRSVIRIQPQILSVSLTIRMRSTVGLKSNPKSVPTQCRFAAAPTAVAAPVKSIDRVKTAACCLTEELSCRRTKINSENVFTGLQTGNRGRAENRIGMRSVEKSQADSRSVKPIAI